jgi:hypothetical protein
MKKVIVEGKQVELQMQVRREEDKDVIQRLNLEASDDATVSDGYHTFDELYEFRKVYNAALFNEWARQEKYQVHKSHKHHDGERCFGGGWFIVVAQLPTGQISNHYELKDWDLFVCEERKKAEPWDGHTANDVLSRLKDAAIMNEAHQGQDRPAH